MQNDNKRFRFLDGLRGWAAIVVLFYHVFIDALPANSIMADRALWAKVFFLNGTLAVCIFFVASGFSLSIRYLETGDEKGLARIAVGRYLRLALPIFAVCAVTYALVFLHVIPSVTQRPEPLNLFLAFQPTIEGLLKFSIFKVFVAYSAAETYDPPLWTMSYEFFGSFMVFAIVALVRPLRLRTWILVVMFVALAIWGTYFALFVAGVLIADMFQQSVRQTAIDFIGAGLCAVAIILTIWQSAWFEVSYIVAAVCLTAGIAFCSSIRNLFENRLSDFLGWISFPLYLVQAAIIYSFSLRGLDVLSYLGFEHSAQRWIVGVATIPVAIFFAIVFTPVNDFAVILSRRFGSYFVAHPNVLTLSEPQIFDRSK